jgi:TPR repeat protein/dienelactone hydrolase
MIDRRPTRIWAAMLVFATTIGATTIGAHAQPLVPIDAGGSVELASQVPQSNGFRTEHVTAVLFEAAGPGRAPGAVIINSSGGVLPHVELFWGRLLAAHGITSLVVDSFTARGVARTTDDQRRLRQSQSDADAVAGFRFLATRPRIDPARILVMGMSKGGETAWNTALPAHMAWLGAKDVMFAAHIALTPGGCNIPYRDVTTTNRPILFLLADLDVLTPATHCLELAERMRQAGNARVERAVYPGDHHNMEWTGGLEFDPAEEVFSACHGYLEADGTYSMGSPPQHVGQAQLRGWLEENCMTLGGYAGGDAVSKRHLVDDLLRFLQTNGFIRDAELDAVLGDCTRFASTYPRQLCERGRAGYIGDIAALGRVLRDGRGAPRDEAQAARLFRLAGERGESWGQLDLALLLLTGSGVPRDQQAAVRLLRLAVDQDNPWAANALGVAYRDGTGVPTDDQMAAQLFRRAALNRVPWAMANLGWFTLSGRGGVTRDATEGVRLIRQAALLGNPLGQFSLAQLYERGEEVTRDLPEARRLYQLSAAQRWNGEDDAQAAIVRLSGASPSEQPARAP